MLVENPKSKRFIVVAMLCLSLLGWGVVGYFRDGYRKLSDLENIVGPVRQVSIQRSHGKNAFYYLTFIVGTNPQPFSIRAAYSEQPLTQLQQKMQVGSLLKVYYSAPRWGARPATFEVYQIESTSHVIYSIEEVRQRALSHGAWALIGWFILVVIALWLYLQQRSALISES